jgi:hypothetical protein
LIPTSTLYSLQGTKTPQILFMAQPSLSLGGCFAFQKASWVLGWSLKNQAPTFNP